MRRPTQAFWIELSKIEGRLGTLDYYELLGVSHDANGEELRAGYERQVRVLHPDRYVRETDPNRKQCLTRVYARVGEAFRVLSHPQKRVSYDRGLLSGETRMQSGRTEQKARLENDPSHPQARSLLMQARELLKGDDLRGARAKLTLAMQYQPDSVAIKEALAACSGAASSPTPPAAVPAPALAPAIHDAPAIAEPATVEPQPVPESAAASGPVGRLHERAPMGQSIRIGCREWSQVKTFYMHNISRGGMLLRCKQPLPIGSVIELSIITPDGESIELPAEVVRHVAPEGPGKRPGIGVRFIVIPEAVRGRFEALLRIAGLSESSDVAETTEDGKGPEQAAKEEADRLIEAGEFQAACKGLQGPVREFPDNTSLRASFHLAAGLMARQRSQDAAAHSHFERALRFDPDSPMILRALREDAS